jgi:murein L,D-transpeptidase YafK
MRFLLPALFLTFLAVPVLAADPQSPRDPGGFYKFLHSFAPETAIKVWRGGNRPDLETLLTLRGFVYGAPLYLRIFKEEGVIEAWLQKGERYELFEVYPICINSGALGPKQKEGDRQAPEGFYEAGIKQLNPNSKYHLAINMGYPNAYDKGLGRTGAHLMIHGACVSIGCYALSDANIEEVYGMAQAAFEMGETSIPIHAFPFRMTQDNIIRHKDSEWIDFWVNELLPAYDVFDITRVPPTMMACENEYEIMDGLDETSLPKSCAPITAWK